jgi:hypothetical protein
MTKTPNLSSFGELPIFGFVPGAWLGVPMPCLVRLRWTSASWCRIDPPDGSVLR